MTAPWFWRPRPAEDPAVVLACFPCMGGDANHFRSWGSALPPDVDVWAARLPGRGARRREPAITDLDELASAFVASLRSSLPPARVALFGHSMGGLLAFEVARALAEAGREPEWLFVAASSAPTTVRYSNLPGRGGDDALLSDLRRLGGTPDEILDDPALLELFLPPLRADAQALKSYRFRPGDALRCGVTALAARDDPIIDADQLARWADVTVGPFRYHRLPGGHHIIRDAEAAVLATIADTLAVLPWA